jgi:hypothetical protein
MMMMMMIMIIIIMKMMMIIITNDMTAVRVLNALKHHTPFALQRALKDCVRPVAIVMGTLTIGKNAILHAFVVGSKTLLEIGPLLFISD